MLPDFVEPSKVFWGGGGGTVEGGNDVLLSTRLNLLNESSFFSTISTALRLMALLFAFSSEVSELLSFLLIDLARL